MMFSNEQSKTGFRALALAIGFLVGSFASNSSVQASSPKRSQNNSPATELSPASQTIKESFLVSFGEIKKAKELILPLCSEPRDLSDAETRVLYAQLAFLKNWKTGAVESGSAGMSSVQLDDPESSPELNVILKVQQLRWLNLFCDASDVRIELLEQLDEAINSAADSELVAIGRAFYTYTKITREDGAFDVTSSLASVEGDPFFQESSDLQIVASWLRTQSRNPPAKVELQRLRETLDLAGDAENSYYVLQLINESLVHAYKANDIALQRGLLLDQIRVTREIGSGFATIKALRRLGNFETRQGKDYRAAVGYLEQALKHPNFATISENQQFKVISDLHRAKLLFDPKSVGPEWKLILENVEAERDRYLRSKNSHTQRVRDFKRVYISKKEFEDSEKALENATSENTELLNKTDQLSNELDSSKIAESRYFWLCLLSLALLSTTFLIYRYQLAHLALRAELSEKKAVLAEEKSKVVELERDVERLKKTESLGLMAGCVAHDFNNLLQGVSGNVELLEFSLDEDSDYDVNFRSERVSAIRTATDRAQQLAKKMLDYSGKQSATMAPVDLNEFVAQELGLVRSVSLDHRFSFERSPEKLMVKCDRMQLHQVLLNFVTNAVEASPSGSEITIRVFKTIVGDGLEASLFGSRGTGGTFCAMEVKDRGKGVEAGQIERIFDPYFSTKSESGRGLGLAVAFGAAETHDGWVRCRPNEDRGTTFQILIPELVVSGETIESDSSPEPLARSSDAESKACEDRRILIVDDEATVLKTCQSMVENLGMEVVTATGGMQALDILTDQEIANSFDCVLMDVVMPEMNAGEVLNELSERGLEVPVVIMSGFSHQRLDFFRDRPNVVGVLPKPFRLKNLKRTLANGIEAGSSQVVHGPSNVLHGPHSKSADNVNESIENR